jgi:hypothetical protein
LRCNRFDRSNNSELQFIEGGHRGLVNSVLTYPHRKISRSVISGKCGGTLLSLEQSPFWGMTSYFLPDNNAVSTAWPNRTFWVHFHIPSAVIFYFFRFEIYKLRKPRQWFRIALYFFAVLVMPSDDGRQWPKLVKAFFHIKLLALDEPY